MNCDLVNWAVVIPFVAMFAMIYFLYQAHRSEQRAGEFYRRGYLAALRVLHEDVRLSENETQALINEKFKQMEDEQCSSLSG